MGRDQEWWGAYGRNVVILSVLWLLYSFLVILGPGGFGYWSATLATACLTAPGLVAEVGFGLIAMGSSKAMTTADLGRGEVSAPEIARH